MEKVTVGGSKARTGEEIERDTWSKIALTVGRYTSKTLVSPMFTLLTNDDKSIWSNKSELINIFQNSNTSIRTI